MIAMDIFKPNDKLHLCLRLCFMHLLHDDINRVAIEWNQHLIETKIRYDTIRGKPDVLYFTPQLYNTESFGAEVNLQDAMTILNEVEVNILPGFDPAFLQLVSEILPNKQAPVRLKKR